MRVAVTGATGFVGGAIVHALVAAGHEVHAYGRRQPGAVTALLPRYRQWDIADGPAPLDADAVVHCAAAVGQRGTRSHFARVNEQGTANVVASTEERASLVYVSTASVYPNAQHARPITESMGELPEPRSPYAISKFRGERIALARRASAVVLRPHIVYGPGDSTLWPRVVAARRRDTLFVPGNGRNAVSVTHVENLASAVLLSLAETAAPGVYNIADAVVPTVDSLLRTMFERHCLPTRLRYLDRSLALSAAVASELAWWAFRLPGEPALTRFAVAGLADPCVLDIGLARRGLRYEPKWNYLEGPL